MMELESSEPTEPVELMIEAPPSLLPDLTEWGIEEIDRGVCEDTAENRKTIRINKGTWQPVFDQNGMPTGYIQVVSAEMRNRATYEERLALLQDPTDPNSDYITGFNLIAHPEAKNLVSLWVLHRTRGWLKYQDLADEMGDDIEAMDSLLIAPPGRCGAIKSDGSRCWRWHDGTKDADGLCTTHWNTHGSAKKIRRPRATPNMRQVAQNRLASNLLGAIDVIEELMQTATSEPVRLAAAKEWLDKGGMKEALVIEEKVEIKSDDATKIVLDRLAKLKKGHDDKVRIIDELERKHTHPQEDEPEVEYIAVPIEENEDD